MKCSSKWEAKVKRAAQKCQYSTKPETNSNFTDLCLYTRFLLKANRRHPSDLEVKVHCSIKHHERFSLFQCRNSIFLINFTCPQSSSAGGLWSRGYCYSESELTQTTHSLRIDKNSNISTWFTFLRELCFSPCLSCTPLRHIIRHSVINTGYLNHFLSKKANQTYF